LPGFLLKIRPDSARIFTKMSPDEELVALGLVWWMSGVVDVCVVDVVQSLKGRCSVKKKTICTLRSAKESNLKESNLRRP